MGDYCYLTVRTLPAHVPLFEPFMEVAEEIVDEETREVTEIHLVDEEANYGYGERLEKLADRGVVFISQSGAGGQYGPMSMVSDGSRQTWEVETDWDNVDPVVTFNIEKMEVDAKSLEQVVEYANAYKRVEAIFRGELKHPRLCGNCLGDGQVCAESETERLHLGTSTCPTCGGTGIDLLPVPHP